MHEGQASVKFQNFTYPTQIWLLDFRYVTAAALVLVLSAFSLKGIVGVGIGLFALFIFFFFLYRGVKRLTLNVHSLTIHSLMIKSLEIQLTTRGCCRARLLSFKENCVLVFESFHPGLPKPSGRVARKSEDRVQILLPRLNHYNHPTYQTLVGWLESRGIPVTSPQDLQLDPDTLEPGGSHSFLVLLLILAVVLIALALFSSSGTHPL